MSLMSSALPQANFDVLVRNRTGFTVQLESVRHRVAPVDKVPTLPYHYDDLEPHIDTRTMQMHYDGCAPPPHNLTDH